MSFPDFLNLTQYLAKASVIDTEPDHTNPYSVRGISALWTPTFQLGIKTPAVFNNAERNIHTR